MVFKQGWEYELIRSSSKQLMADTASQLIRLENEKDKHGHNKIRI